MKANDVTYAHMLSSDHVHFFDPESLRNLLRAVFEAMSRSNDPIRFIHSGFVGRSLPFYALRLLFRVGLLKPRFFSSTLCCCERSRKLIWICASSARRQDGYHEFDTVFQTIDWFDEILIDRALSGLNSPRPERRKTKRTWWCAPCAHMSDSRSSHGECSHIRLTKNIPIGRGLGGGSSDAAVTFMDLQRFFKRALRSEPKCFRSCATSDPMCRSLRLAGGPQDTGRGDEVGRSMMTRITGWFSSIRA